MKRATERSREAGVEEVRPQEVGAQAAEESVASRIRSVPVCLATESVECKGVHSRSREGAKVDESLSSRLATTTCCLYSKR